MRLCKEALNIGLMFSQIRSDQMHNNQEIIIFM